MIEASCHCGAFRAQIATRPRQLTACNCSICHRLGALWAYFHAREITITAGAGSTIAYVWGAHRLEIHHCSICGCTTHWKGISNEYAERMAINARLLEPSEIADLQIRHFDGASSWSYLD
jgi:hypothetical protein